MARKKSNTPVRSLFARDNTIPVSQPDVPRGGKRSVLARRKIIEQSQQPHAPQSATRQLSVALYCRVSTDESVQSNLSIPDQERQMRHYADENGLDVKAVYREEGRSAKTADRPVFRQMIDDCFSPDHPYDRIIIFHTGRFSRRQGDFERVMDSLYMIGVEIISITQRFQNNVGGFVGWGASVLFDELHSRKTAEDVTRTMNQMARNGFHVGGVLPFGYKAVPCEGDKRHKVVVINEEELPIAKKIFEWALYGDEQEPPMGVKSITNRLNKREIRTRAGARWGNYTVHSMLTNPIYMGKRLYNVSSVPRQWISESPEIIEIDVPPIISRKEFDDLQSLLRSKDPRVGSSRTISSPMLLAGLARCTCGSAMTLRTGTGSQGKTYRYYHCSRTGKCGKFDCTGPVIPEAVLDSVVVDRVIDEVTCH